MIAEQPVSLTVLGIILIVLAVGCSAGLAVRIIFGGTLGQFIQDCLLGFIGALVASILLPMNGIGARSAEGSLASAAIAGLLLISVGRLISSRLRP